MSIVSFSRRHVFANLPGMLATFAGFRASARMLDSHDVIRRAAARYEAGRLALARACRQCQAIDPADTEAVSRCEDGPVADASGEWGAARDELHRLMGRVGASAVVVSMRFYLTDSVADLDDIGSITFPARRLLDLDAIGGGR